MAEILIVDDEPINCMILEQMLSKQYRSASCHSGQEACEKVQTGVYDLILLDIHMPDMDGFETIRRLRAQGYAGKIIIVTADHNSGNAVQGARAGANGFLIKPVQGDLCKLVEGFLGA